MNDSLQYFQKLREELHDELMKIDEQIGLLVQRKAEIEEVLYGKPKVSVKIKEDSLQGKVLAYIQINPGCGRADIAEGIEYEGNMGALSNVLILLRSKGHIRNEGNKNSSRWFPINREDSSI